VAGRLAHARQIVAKLNARRVAQIPRKPDISWKKGKGKAEGGGGEWLSLDTAAVTSHRFSGKGGMRVQKGPSEKSRRRCRRRQSRLLLFLRTDEW